MFLSSDKNFLISNVYWIYAESAAVRNPNWYNWWLTWWKSWVAAGPNNKTGTAWAKLNKTLAATQVATYLF